MKLTKSKLQQIIREEFEAFSEGYEEEEIEASWERLADSIQNEVTATLLNTVKEKLPREYALDSDKVSTLLQDIVSDVERPLMPIMQKVARIVQEIIQDYEEKK